MPTISELKAAHDAEYGSSREFRVTKWDGKSTWFAPKYIDCDSYWYGLNDQNISEWFHDSVSIWHLWQESKPRKVVYLWVVCDPDGQMYTPIGWYDEAEIKRHYKDGRRYHKLLPGRDAETGEVVDE